MSFLSHIGHSLSSPFERFLSLRLLLVLLSGVWLSFAQAPYSYWPFIFPTLGLFFFCFALAQNKKQAFATSYLFSLGYFGTGLYWIGNALLVEGNEAFLWAWPLAVVALPALLSLFTALYMTVGFILFNKTTLSKFFAFCVFLALSEWVRGYAFTGFPWNLYGYAWINVLPVAQFVSYAGPFALTFMTILWGGFAGFFVMPRVPWAQKFLLGIFMLITYAGVYALGIAHLTGNSFDTPYKNINIRIVQPNIAQTQKWLPDQLVTNFNKHLDLSKPPLSTNPSTIIIWPETALSPALLNSAAVQERIGQILGPNDLLLAGGLDVTRALPSGEPIYHNALMAWQAGQPYRRLYSKSHLVPFGEYIPFQKYIPLQTVTNFSGFEEGTGPRTISSIIGFPSFSPLICYEIVFPHEAVAKDQPRPDYILTITNDGWYGDSPGPYQHFTQARFRAIEQGIPVVRSANTGVSGVIGPFGRVLARTKLMEDSTLETPFPARLERPTLYYQQGDLIFFTVLIFAFFMAILFRHKYFS